MPAAVGNTCAIVIGVKFLCEDCAATTVHASEENIVESVNIEGDVCMWQVHAEGEAEHAALGHAAVTGFAPAGSEGTLARAMADHDRDFAVFYNRLADMLV